MFKKRLFRIGWWLLPTLALTTSIVVACSSDDESGGGSGTETDSGVDTGTSQPIAEGGSSTDAGADTSSGDAGMDVMGQPDVDAALPPLCVQFPNDPADASPAEQDFRKLYELIALRAILKASDSCEIGARFVDLEDTPPSVLRCYANQLKAIAGCKTAGQVQDYAVSADDNGARCVPDAGAPGDTIRLGFRNPPGTYTANDVDELIAFTRAAAVDAGLPATAADRLQALLLAEKATVAPNAVDAGLSASTCP